VNKSAIAVLCLALCAVEAEALEQAAQPARALIAQARKLGEDIQDQALAALYNRLFALQDKRREAELRNDSAELTVAELALAYSKEDRFRMEPGELKEIASNPDHPRYPNITESRKLEILAQVRLYIRVQKLVEFELKKIERDLAEVQKLIAEHLARRGPARP
jgi:hypothetical protein